MKTSNLLVLGSAAVLALAGPAWADETAPDAAMAEMGELGAESAADQPEVAEEPAPEEDLAAAEPVVHEVGEMPPAAMPEAAPAEEPLPGEMAAEADSLATETAGEMAGGEMSDAMPDPMSDAMEGADAAAVAEVPVEMEAPATPALAPATPALGQVGYDEQGRPGRIHVVIRGDTLWDISNAYLGTPWVWPSIWTDNQDIENPHLIFPEDRIWITPWEMRKVTPAEAEALLAGTPAAPDPTPMLTPEEPETTLVQPQIATVREEQPSVFVSDRDMVGLVTPEAVEAAASIVSAVEKQRVMLSQHDRVWIGLGEDSAELGDQFTIFRVQEKVYDPETGRMLGYHVAILGWLAVTDVHAETSSALIRESHVDIEIGDRIMPRMPTVKEVAVQPSPGDVAGQISFLAQQRTLMGTMEYVYLNRGTLDGIEVGSPLQVYRQGFMANESTRGERVEVPDRVVADLLVVKAEPEVSAALIRHTEEELALGDRFRGSGN